MEAMEAILTRRSIRKYKEQSIPPELIEKILRAAMQAPSANNEQPWRFIIVEKKETLIKLGMEHPYAKMLLEASVAIVVCGDTTLEKSPGYWVVDTSAATQNILLAAHALGLGAVWLGVYPRPERMALVGTIFALPKAIQPLAIVSLGYPDETKSPTDRFMPDRIIYDR